MKKAKATKSMSPAARALKGTKTNAEPGKKSALRAPRPKKAAEIKDPLLLEATDLRLRLNEAEETLAAIRKGEVDALVISGPRGEQVYTLKGAEQPYRILVESMNEGALSLTESGAIINCNLAFAKIAGTSYGSLIGQSFLDMVPEKGRERFKAFWQKALEQEAKTEIELDFVGRTVPVYLSLNARVCDEESLVFTIVTDISERKHTEAELEKYRLHLEQMVDVRTGQLQAINEELQTTNEKLLAANNELAVRTAEIETLINSISDAVVYTDTKQRILLANPAVTTVFGFTQDELAGKTLELLYTDAADFERAKKNRYTFTLGQCRPVYETCYRHKDGTVFVGETRDAVVRDPHDAPLGFISVYRDITERRKAEEEISKLDRELKQKVEELEESNRELEAYTYSVSHDLRAPLRSVSGFAKAMVEDYADRLDDQGRDFLVRIHNGSERMDRLINDLLHLSRISRQEIAFGRADLSTVATTLVAEMRRDCPERAVQVEIQEGITAHADHGLMWIVIENLIGNAWKFTSKKNTAKIVFGSDEKSDKTVYHVKDNGVGFNPAYADRMFRPFQRLHSDTEFEGTGIGLAIVERIIRRHGGKIWAEGEVGKGATMYFTLP